MVLLCMMARVWRAASISVLCGAAAFALDNPVRIDTGLVAGIPGEVTVFKGIPYAAAPVRKLRWKPPQPAPHWQGVREATRFGAICMQSASLLRDPALPMSEDCLTLNVWTPAKNAGERLPVMVWIHGGGFRRGSTSQPQYDGERLARKSVVVVSMNYRLGIFGFLAHPVLSAESPKRVSGNYGILDEIAALAWVQRNIRAFGGDSSRVTIFGESAGGFSVLLLNTSPLAKGLFQRAISESGGMMIPHLRQAWLGDPAAEAVGEQIAPDLTALRSRSAKEILEIADKRQSKVQSVFLGLVFRPVVDGWVIPIDPVSAYRAGHLNAAQLLAGTNANEGSLFGGALPLRTTAEFREYLRSRFHAPGDVLDKTEAVLGGTGSVRKMIARFIGDVMFFWPTREALLGTASSGRSAWQYEFTRVNGAGANGSGAFHGAEIPYVFGPMNVVPIGFGPVRAGTYDEADLKLSRIMQDDWVRFARSGAPNWPQYSRTRTYLQFDAKRQTGRDLRREELDVLSRIMSASAGWTARSRKK